MSTGLLNPYCTLEDVQRELQNSEPDEAKDLLIAINAASRWIDAHCHRDFLLHDHSTTALRVPGSWCVGNEIFLPWPVLSLSKIELEAADGSKTEVAASEYRVVNVPHSNADSIVRSSRWIPRESARSMALPPVVLFTGRFGYEPATKGQAPNLVADTSKPPIGLPGDLTTACAVVAAVRSGKWRKEVTDPSGGKTSTALKNLPAETMRTLNRLRRPVI